MRACVVTVESAGIAQRAVFEPEKSRRRECLIYSTTMGVPNHKHKMEGTAIVISSSTSRHGHHSIALVASLIVTVICLKVDVMGLRYHSSELRTKTSRLHNSLGTPRFDESQHTSAADTTLSK